MKFVTENIQQHDFKRAKAEGTDQSARVEEVSAKCEVYCTTLGQGEQISCYYEQFFEGNFIHFQKKTHCVSAIHCGNIENAVSIAMKKIDLCMAKSCVSRCR